MTLYMYYCIYYFYQNPILVTAIVGVINTQGIAVAADSAVTVSNGKEAKKVYNTGNKIFMLSKKFPVGIAIYNNSDFMGIPWEIIIKKYRAEFDQNNIELDTLKDYRLNFIEYTEKLIPSFVSQDSKDSALFRMCEILYKDISTRFQAAYIQKSGTKNDIEATKIFNDMLETYHKEITSLNKNSNLALNYTEFTKAYEQALKIITAEIITAIKSIHVGWNISKENEEKIYDTIFHVCQIAKIFESNYTGLVFFGFGKNEIFPSVLSVFVSVAVLNRLRYIDDFDFSVNPPLDTANIIPYAQYDVTTSILKGMHPRMNNMIQSQIINTTNNLVSEIETKYNVTIDSSLATKYSTQFKDAVSNYGQDTISMPIVDMLKHMGKEDMAELAESLVNITSLIIKFSETTESVGPPVDVAVVTKGDGFIWMKRKHYFDPELNKNFIARNQK